MDRSEPENGLPSCTVAEALLAEAAARNPGPWEAHSRYVAQGAVWIAARHPALDPERAYIYGLLHDIGRRFGVTGMRHALDGYHFLVGEGYPDPARICLTHSYPVKGEAVGATPWDGSQEEYRFLQDYLAGIEYDDYDRLIQVCDCLALPSGLCLMEKRMVDVVRRYGFNANTLPRWDGYYAAKACLEQAVGVSLYRLLPGVVENTFEWTVLSASKI
jgi:hypothetical protein